MAEKEGLGEFCCDLFQRNVTHECKIHDKFECPDTLLINLDKWWCISVKDGGSSGVAIWFCPWCGKKLKPKEG